MKQHLAVLGSVLLLGLMLTCYNPASVPVPDPLCSGLHPKKVSGICHGANFRDPAGYCDEANCHGSDLKGGNTVGPSCYSCHGPYWEVLSQHNHVIYGKKHYKVVCTTVSFETDCGSDYCHGAALTGTNGYMKSPSCAKCHGNPFGTADGSNCNIPTHNGCVSRHGPTVGTDLTPCRNTACHGAGLTGGTTGLYKGGSCNRCHGIPGGPGCDD
jgi:hypothetical protein